MPYMSAMVSDIANILEANPGSVFNVHRHDVEARSTQNTSTRNRLNSEVESTWYPAAQLTYSHILELLMR